MPNVINFAKNRIVESLIHKNYLSTLKTSVLEDVKRECTKIILGKKGKRDERYLNESLAEYEAKISELILQPYHEYFRLNIHCEDCILKNSLGENVRFIRKTYKKTFKTINPMHGMATVKLFSALNVCCPDNFDCAKLIELKKVTIKTDLETTPKDITEIVKLSPSINETRHPNYNYRINYLINLEDPSYSFNNEITVEIEEIRYIVDSDQIYIQRVNVPSKNLLINYSYSNPNFKLKIEGFGIDANMTDGKFIKTENGNSVMFESFSWLLPGNGIIVAFIPVTIGNS